MRNVEFRSRPEFTHTRICSHVYELFYTDLLPTTHVSKAGIMGRWSEVSYTNGAPGGLPRTVEIRTHEKKILIPFHAQIASEVGFSVQWGA